MATGAGKPVEKIDARQLRTRRNLFDALLRLLENRPFEELTIREIAAEAGIGYATYFRHFPSKEALLEELAAGEINQLIERSWPVLASRGTRESCVALFTFLDEHRRVWSALLTGGASAALKQAFIQHTLAMAEQAGQVPGDLPGELRVVTSVAATVELIAWWLRQEDYPIVRIAEALDKLVVAPAMADVPAG